MCGDEDVVRGALLEGGDEMGDECRVRVCVGERRVEREVEFVMVELNELSRVLQSTVASL